jgi:hypothetical protein
MDDTWLRIVDDMAGRVSGPMRFRLLLQPTMAAIFAITSGTLRQASRRISGGS